MVLLLKEGRGIAEVPWCYCCRREEGLLRSRGAVAAGEMRCY